MKINGWSRVISLLFLGWVVFYVISLIDGASIADDDKLVCKLNRINDLGLMACGCFPSGSLLIRVNTWISTTKPPPLVFTVTLSLNSCDQYSSWNTLDVTGSCQSRPLIQQFSLLFRGYGGFVNGICYRQWLLCLSWHSSTKQVGQGLYVPICDVHSLWWYWMEYLYIWIFTEPLGFVMFSQSKESKAYIFHWSFFHLQCTFALILFYFNNCDPNFCFYRFCFLLGIMCVDWPGLFVFLSLTWIWYFCDTAALSYFVWLY